MRHRTYGLSAPPATITDTTEEGGPPVACQKTCDLLEHVRILNNGRQVRECTACGGIYLTDGNPDKVIRRPRANPEA